MSGVKRPDMSIPKASLMSTTLACLLLGCFDAMSRPTWPPSGTIVIKALAPDQASEAVLIASKERGRYLFEIRDSKAADILAQIEISAPLSYHEHIVYLHWPATRRAEATIDYDFGDNNLKFTLSY